MHKSYEITLLRDLSSGLGSFSSKPLAHSINASGTRSIATFRYGEMTIYNIVKGEYTQPFHNDWGDIWGVTLSERDSMAITIAAPARHIHTSSDYWILGLWDIDTAKLISEFKISSGCYHFAATTDLSLVMGSHIGKISWWNTRRGQCIGSVDNPHSRDIFRVALSADALLGATVPVEGREVIIWDIDAKNPLKTITLPKPKLFSKRERINEIRFGTNRLYISTNTGKLWVADSSGEKQEMIFDTGLKRGVEAFDINEKASLAALHFWEGRLQLWDMGSSKLIGAALTGHKDQVTDVKITPDVCSVITACKDGTVREWSLQEENSQL